MSEVVLSLGLGLAALILLAVTLIKPQLPLYGWICFLPVQLEFLRDYIGVHFAPSDALIPFLLLGCVVDAMRKKEVCMGTSLVLSMGGLLLAFGISLGVGLEYLGYLSMYGLVNKFVGLMLLILTYCGAASLLRTERRRLHFPMGVALISGFAVNVISLAAYVGSVTVGLESTLITSGRINGFILDSNAHGGYLAVIFFLQLAALRVQPAPISRKVMWVNALLLPVGLFLTFSRSAWLAFGAGLVVSGAVWGRRLWVPLLMCGTFLLVLIGAVFPGISGWWAEDDAPTDMALRSSTVLSRLSFIEEGLALWAERPVFGIGLGSYLELNQWTTMIHNTYLWLLVDTGLVGLSVCGALFFGVWRNLRVALRAGTLGSEWARGVLAAFVSMLGFMMGIEGLYQRHLWFLFAVSEVLSRTLRCEGLRPTSVPGVHAMRSNGEQFARVSGAALSRSAGH